MNRVRDVEASVDHAALTLEQIESNPVRCPDPEAAERMYQGEGAQVPGRGVSLLAYLLVCLAI